MTQGPWSVKGIDPKARSVARERAHRRGVTLGQYLNSLLLDDDAPAGRIEDVEIAGFGAPRSEAAEDVRRMSVEIDELSQKLEASQQRSARSMAGIDKSILGLMGKVETSGRAQLQALERVTRAMGEIETTQAALRSRIDSLEADGRSGATVGALRSLEESLGRLAGAVGEKFNSFEGEQAAFRDLFEEKVSRVSNRVDDFARGLDTTITQAVRAGSAGLTERVDGIEQQMSAAERRMEGALSRITDAASRFELFETKAERAVGDTTWRMERALESTLTRSRAMSKELLDRVDGIEEKTREAVTGLGDAVSRITERLTRAERRNDNVAHVLERSVTELDDRLGRISQTGGSGEELARIQQTFQKRLETLAEDLSRPIQAVRHDVERKLEEAVRSGQPEKLERLERTIRQVQDQLAQSELRQAGAVEAMSAQVDRLSRAVEDRLKTIELRDDGRSVEDVRREMLRLADSIEARLTSNESQARSAASAIEHLRSDVSRFGDTFEDRLQTADRRTAAAIDEMGGQVSQVAERMQRRQDESIQRLVARIEEQRAGSFGAGEFDRLAERIDERVRDSERRSAEAISQIGEQVARVADRLQTQHQESLRTLEARLAESDRSHETRLSEVLADMSRRMDEIGEQSSAALAPVHKTVSSIAKRVEEIEDGVASGARPAPAPQAGPELASLADDLMVIDEPVVAASPVEDIPEPAEIAGVEPPPFDRHEAALFEDMPGAKPADAAPASDIDDLLDIDDVVLDPPAAPQEFVADLPDDTRERPSQAYLSEARRAAQQGRRVVADTGSTGRRGIGRGPLIAASALAVAVAGGAAWTVMRGKQDATGNDDFARLDPAAPQTAAGDPQAAAAVLFGDDGRATPPAAAAPQADPRNPAAADLFDEPAKTPPAAAAPAAAPKATASAGGTTLTDAVSSGDPVALHDYAMELLATGEKARGVQLLRDASGKGLVMAQYRLAKLYEKGEGVPRDMAASRAWTEKAAIGGNVKAMHDLAVFYAEGDAGPQSYAAAVEWFRQASDMGLVDSQYNLAVLYEQGLGVSQDKAEAAYWFEVASRGGDRDAGTRSRTMLTDMSTAQSEQIKRKARGFSPRAPIARANGDFGKRSWETVSTQQIAEAQRLLSRLGYNPGVPNGKTGDKTEEAIRQFEMDNDLPSTGEPSATLLRQLRAATLNAGN